MNELKKALFCIPVVLMLVSATTLAQTPTTDAKYTGVAKCGMCHSDVHKSWQTMAHARAFDLLVNVSEEKNAACLPCHSTGFGKGGYVDEASTPELKGVTCEACHGPGGEHMGDKAKIVGSPAASVCADCHQALNIHSR